jgi:hypothetical protein
MENLLDTIFQAAVCPAEMNHSNYPLKKACTELGRSIQLADFSPPCQTAFGNSSTKMWRAKK